MKSLLVFISILTTSAVLQAKTLIRTEAQVKDHVITSREVQIHQLLQKNMGGRFENFKKDSSIEWVIKEWLLYFEASSFYNVKVGAGVVAKRLREVEKKIKSQPGYKKLSVQKSELRNIVRRRLEAERLYTFKKKASVLPVSMNEIETEYTQNRIRYGNMNFDEAKNQIRQNKIQDNLQLRLEQWFRVLERKYKVQRFFRFEGA